MRVLFVVIFLIFFGNLQAAEQTSYCPFGQSKYDYNNFSHFSYLNPDAPKSGQIIFGKESDFSSFNAFTADGLIDTCGLFWTFDRLMMRSFDETLTYYPLVARSFELGDDFLLFHINPDAKWSDGEKITAYDVQNSYENILQKGQVYWRHYFAPVQKVEVLNELTIKFIVEKGSLNNHLITQLMNLPLLPHELFENVLYTQKNSGPYYIKNYRLGEFIHFMRNPNYWGKDLVVNRGRFNFDDLICKYYKNHQVMLQAFEAGDFDIYHEKNAQHWSDFKGKRVKSHDVKALQLQFAGLKRFKTLAFNTQKKPFDDWRVRKALNLLFDFDFINKKNFFNQYKRANDFLLGWEFLWSGALNEQEQNLLQKLESSNASVLPITTYKKYKNNIDYALNLLQQAGFKIKKGKLCDDCGQSLKINIILNERNLIKILNVFFNQLRSLGFALEVTLTDKISYLKCLQNKDFDIIYYEYYYGRIPNGELFHYLHSKFVNVPIMNPQSINNESIDKLLDYILVAENFNDIKVALNLLNRIIISENYAIHLWYNPYLSLVMTDKFAIPDNFPQAEYYDEKSMFGTDCWWAK